MISHTLTNVPGSSAYFRQAYIVYSNRTKQEDLGVPGHLLAQHGGSQPGSSRGHGGRGCAAKQKSISAWRLQVLRARGGGSAAKPVGLVYIAIASSGDTIVERHLWQGCRVEIKERAALAALRLLWLQSRC